MRQLFFIEGRLLGEAPRQLTRYKEQLAPPVSTLHYCEVCGEVYAKCPVISPSGAAAQWVSYRGRCRKCPSRWGAIAGSIWSSYDRDFIAAFPHSVLLREFQLHLSHFLEE